MFRETKCGCIASMAQGYVRYCATHAKDRSASIDGGDKLIKRYPANGVMPSNWSGK